MPLTDAEKRAARKASYLGFISGVHAWQDKPGPAQAVALLRGIDPDDALYLEVALWLGYKDVSDYMGACCTRSREVQARLYEEK